MIFQFDDSMFLTHESTQRIIGQIKDDYESYLLHLELIDDLTLIAKKCESPIESLLFWALVSSWRCLVNTPQFPNDDKATWLLPFEFSYANSPLVSLTPQITINKDNLTFRVDFLISCYHWNNKDMVEFCVEVDGHNFHEKTKEQAIRDKFRDRTLQKWGYKVIHYTGSEVYKDPYRIVADIKTMIMELWND